MDDATLDRIVGEWHIYQLRRGHRFSTDDLLTAWTAFTARPDATRLLDLGCGIGSVGLMTLWHLPAPAILVGVEVQAISVELARRSVQHNGLEDRVFVHHQDLRTFRSEQRFPLITGSPPYIPPDKGVHSPHPQRAGARMELRGDVFDYCRAAAAHLGADGVFAMCHAGQDPRPPKAIAEAGLRIRHRREVFFRCGKPATIALYLAAWDGEEEKVEPLVIRDAKGHHTEQYLSIRGLFAS